MVKRKRQDVIATISGNEAESILDRARGIPQKAYRNRNNGELTPKEIIVHAYMQGMIDGVMIGQGCSREEVQLEPVISDVVIKEQQ